MFSIHIPILITFITFLGGRTTVSLLLNNRSLLWRMVKNIASTVFEILFSLQATTMHRFRAARGAMVC